MKRKRCTASCKHLRSFRYGFDSTRIEAAYNGRDQHAGCAITPGSTINMRGLPACLHQPEA